MRRVASVSFGKDSLAALLLLLEQNERLDEVIFYNSGMEFQAIYDIRDRIKPILEQRGIRFTEVKPGAPFLYNMLDRPVHSKKNGFHLGYGWCGGRCRWGTALKTDALDGVAPDAEVHYVGIAVDEPKRLARLEAPKCSPLAEAGMTEADCLAFCYARGFFWEEEGIRLYDILDRVSCWCCKNKNRKELKAIYQFLPQYWERLKGLQAQIPMPMKPYSRKGVPYGNVCLTWKRCLNRKFRRRKTAALSRRKGGSMSRADKRGRHHLHIELTPAQYRLLSENAMRCGITKRLYIVRLLEGTEVKARPAQEIKELRTEIHHIGNNIVRPDRALCKAEKWYCPAR